MSRSKKSAPVLNEQWAEFVQGSVSVVAASRDANNIPILARAVGCRVSSNRQKVTLFLQGPQAELLLADIRSTGAIAAVFTQPSTHTSVQLKGVDAKMDSVQPGDVAVVERCVEAFVADTTSVGYPPDLIRAIQWFDPHDLVAVTFTPRAAFLQTPGPRAGQPLEC
jgi:hypothetical protein